MKVLAYVLQVLLPTALIVAFIYWVFRPLTSNYIESGTSVVATGGPDGTILVEADSTVCAKGIAEDGAFVIDTPSGKFFSTEVIGHNHYFYGYGCFQPGTWSVTEGAVTVTLTNPKWVRATSIESVRARNLFLYLPIVMDVSIFIVFNLTFIFTRRVKNKVSKS